MDVTEAEKEFNKIYGKMREKYCLKMHSGSSVYRNKDDFIKIWRVGEDGGHIETVSSVKDKDIENCYKKAATDLEFYDRIKTERRRTDKEMHMEVIMEQITLDQWMSWKEDIREKLKETAENFVYIGYRLRQIRDSGMYGGAEDVFEFAFREYSLGKSTVSRFIAINEKFSEGGNSLELKAEYRAIGSSKLAEMLTLTDAECSLITEKTTVAQIRELKNFSRQGPEDAEGQERGEGQERAWMPLQKCIIEYFRGKKGMLDEAMEFIEKGGYKQASEIINPSGNATFKKGIIFLFMYKYEDGVKYKTFGRDDVTAMPWDDFILEIYKIFGPDYSMGGGYGAFYDGAEKEPERESEKVEETAERRNEEATVATSQQKEKEDKEDGKHVEKMESEEMAESVRKEDDSTSEGPADKDESGNDEDGTGGTDGASGDDEEFRDDEDSTHRENPETEPEKDQMAAAVSDYEKDKRIGNYKARIKSGLSMMQECYERQDWKGLAEKAEDIIWNAERIKEWENGQWGKQVYL